MTPGMKVAIVLAMTVLLPLSWMAGCSSDPHTQPGYTTEAEPSTPVQTVPHGQPFDYHDVGSEGETYDWRVRLIKTECGLKTIPDVVANPKWQGEDDVPEYLDAKADPGQQFCVLSWSWENVGQRPGQPDAAGDLVVEGRRYTRAGEDEEMSERLMEARGHKWKDVNPGGKSDSLDVYLVPEGKTPEAVWFPYENMVHEQSTILVATS
jgi:hypothetical protein